MIMFHVGEIRSLVLIYRKIKRTEIHVNVGMKT